MVMPELLYVHKLKSNIWYVCMPNEKYLEIINGIPNKNNTHTNEILLTCKVSFSGIST